jgi:hypothetical protein
MVVKDPSIAGYLRLPYSLIGGKQNSGVESRLRCASRRFG